MALKGVIFDHDGTLVDSEKSHFQVWKDIIGEYGVDFPEQEYILHHAGVPTLGNASLLVETYSLPITPETLSKVKEARIAKVFAREGTSLMPFALESVQRCHHLGLTLAVATGATGEEIALSMTRHFDSELFATTVTRDNVEHSKPAPDTYLLALKQLGLDAEQCIAVEDSPSGVNAALAAKLRVIAIANDYSKHQDLSNATYHCQDLSAATTLIEKLSIE